MPKRFKVGDKAIVTLDKNIYPNYTSLKDGDVVLITQINKFTYEAERGNKVYLLYERELISTKPDWRV